MAMRPTAVKGVDQRASLVYSGHTPFMRELHQALILAFARQKRGTLRDRSSIRTLQMCIPVVSQERRIICHWIPKRSRCSNKSPH